ncbi:MAG: hypothetical protein U0640_09635 [Phycisphaerales bacterium]
MDQRLQRAGDGSDQGIELLLRLRVLRNGSRKQAQCAGTIVSD